MCLIAFFVFVLHADYALRLAVVSKDDEKSDIKSIGIGWHCTFALDRESRNSNLLSARIQKGLSLSPYARAEVYSHFRSLEGNVSV